MAAGAELCVGVSWRPSQKHTRRAGLTGHRGVHRAVDEPRHGGDADRPRDHHPGRPLLRDLILALELLANEVAAANGQRACGGWGGSMVQAVRVVSVCRNGVRRAPRTATACAARAGPLTPGPPPARLAPQPLPSFLRSQPTTRTEDVPGTMPLSRRGWRFRACANMVARSFGTRTGSAAAAPVCLVVGWKACHVLRTRTSSLAGGRALKALRRARHTCWIVASWTGASVVWAWGVARRKGSLLVWGGFGWLN